MKDLLIVGAGGAMGAIARFKLGGLVLHHTLDWKFPAATFVVNVTGCVAAGALAGLVERHDLLRPEVRLLLFTGVLGGFTTFSAFGLETAYLLRRGATAAAFANVVLSVIVGLGTLLAAFHSIPHSRVR
jgi:CrcB protein